jgi:PAS domain S-box-containing protein
VPDSLIDLAGLQVGAEDFLAAVLSTAAQPIWVVDPEGVIRFANPAAIATLGYDCADDLLGCHSHQTIHHSHPDGTPYPAAECPMLLPRVTGETVSSDLDWFFRRDGSMFPVSYVSAPIEMHEGRGAVVAFTDIEERRRIEQELRERDEVLAVQLASLRRVATLVAGGAASAEVLAAVAREVGQVVSLPMVALWRYGPGRTATVLGEWSEHPHPFRVGTCWPLDGPTICAKVLDTGRPSRIEDFGDIPGTIAGAARETGIGSCAGAPIIVGGQVWGAMSADTLDRKPLAEGIEDRLAEFTELVATAISSSASREALVRLADEQAALRRVATLVARESPPREVFAAVAAELGRFLPVEDTAMLRYEDDGTATVVASWGKRGDVLKVGTRMPVGGENVTELVRRTGRPARIDDYATATGAIGAHMKGLGVSSAVGCPIVVDGRRWGIMLASQGVAEPLPAETEARIAKFTELVATAISNVQARSDLAESRARIVAAADDERRRVVRDLHDGAQQRLVNAIVTLKLAREALEQGQESATGLVGEALDHAQHAIADLRELSHGILPTILTRGGLRAAIETLASRTPVPVKVTVSVDSLPAAVEATAYFVVAEALTNVAKHARATSATVVARIEDGSLQLRVHDDGAGGARPDGSGLVGLADRLAALDGELGLESTPGGGTLVTADIPLPS